MLMDQIVCMLHTTKGQSPAHETIPPNQLHCKPILCRGGHSRPTGGPYHNPTLEVNTYTIEYLCVCSSLSRSLVFYLQQPKILPNIIISNVDGRMGSICFELTILLLLPVCTQCVLSPVRMVVSALAPIPALAQKGFKGRSVKSQVHVPVYCISHDCTELYVLIHSAGIDS
jgi:hypothetical protein